MSDITLYHNPRCSKSRAALQLLQERGLEPQIRLYLENPPGQAELSELLGRLGITARELLRRSEAAYKEHNLKDPDLSEEQLISAMVAHPKLIERPIAIRDKRAVIGRPPENVLELL